MVDVTLVGATCVDWERFLRATLPSKYHPAKTVDASKVQNNLLFNFLIGITTISDLREGSTGKPSRNALRHVVFTFVVHVNKSFFGELDSSIKVNGLTTQSSTEKDHLIGVITADIQQFKNLILHFSHKDCRADWIEVANKLLLCFEQIGFARLWSDYRKVPFGSFFILEAI